MRETGSNLNFGSFVSSSAASEKTAERGYVDFSVVLLLSETVWTKGNTKIHLL